jgi:hypothetical protein
MTLDTKPDLEDVKQRWNAFWNDEVLDRPMVCAMAPKDGGRELVNVMGPRYWNACTGNYDAQLDLLDEWVEKTCFMGDLIPNFSPDHGPDQFGAWMGSVLRFSPGCTETNWAEPVLKEWEDFLPVRLEEDNPVWQSTLKYSELLEERGKGKYIVGMADLHSHMDAFSALRHPDALCMDLYDEPELVQQGLMQARAMFQPVYDKLYAAGGMSKETGTVSWLPMWCEGKTSVVQCDFSVFISNEMWRQFVLPGVEEEVNWLDRSFYHLDGRQQLIHLDDLLALPNLDGVQWVPGAGQPEMFLPCWRDVLKKILQAGKKVIVFGELNIDIVKDVHNDLGAQGVVYDISGQTHEEIQAITQWLTENT